MNSADRYEDMIKQVFSAKTEFLQVMHSSHSKPWHHHHHHHASTTITQNSKPTKTRLLGQHYWLNFDYTAFRTVPWQGPKKHNLVLQTGLIMWIGHCKDMRKLTRLRTVPLFYYSPSRAERKKQAARKLALRKLLSGRKALSTDYKKTKRLLVLLALYRSESHWWRANAQNISFRIYLWWPNHIIKPVDKTRLSCYTSQRRRTTVSLETYNSPRQKKDLHWSCHLDKQLLNLSLSRQDLINFTLFVLNWFSWQTTCVGSCPFGK